MSGYDYFYSGKVIGGNRIGHSIGVPTINLPVSEGKDLPEFGVYAAKVYLFEVGTDVKKEYKGIANLGVKPTIFSADGSNPIGIEVNIFDFDSNLYDEYVEVSLLDFIRPEKKFADVEELKAQINKDIAAVKKLFTDD